MVALIVVDPSVNSNDDKFIEYARKQEWAIYWPDFQVDYTKMSAFESSTLDVLLNHYGVQAVYIYGYSPATALDARSRDLATAMVTLEKLDWDSLGEWGVQLLTLDEIL